VSAFTRHRALALLVPLAGLGVALFATPAAQAATAKPAVTARPLTEWVNCANATEGESGGQWYIEDACSPVEATSWALAVECSNDLWYTSSFFTSFENVSEYCPAGYPPIDAVIDYTT
jgi:hypothetical protein